MSDFHAYIKGAFFGGLVATATIVVFDWGYATAYTAYRALSSKSPRVVVYGPYELVNEVMSPDGALWAYCSIGAVTVLDREARHEGEASDDEAVAQALRSVANLRKKPICGRCFSSDVILPTENVEENP